MSKLFKKTFFALTMMLPVTAFADSYLVVKNQQGVQAAFALSDNPEVEFGVNEIAISDGNQNITIEKSNHLSFYFSPTKPAITAVERVEADGKQLVSVYDTVGRLVMQERTSDGIMSINFSSLPKGIYIVKTGSTVIKIANN